MGFERRVLSIQSHVVSGYVGNKAAVFPLQLLGFDVDIINSVNFSNHTGYPHGVEGDVLNGEMLGNLINGLEKNELLFDDNNNSKVGHILTGYIGSESFLRAVVSVVKRLKMKKRPNNSNGPNCRYVCDPVLGDMGKFYAPQELVNIYREEVLPLADVVTPNQFEVEQLTGITIHSVKDAQRACHVFHDMGPSLVLITSIIFPETSIIDNDKEVNTETLKRIGQPKPNSIAMFASQRSHQQSTQHKNAEQYILYLPLFPGHFTGTGDVCAALFLGWSANTLISHRNIVKASDGSHKANEDVSDLTKQRDDHEGEGMGNGCDNAEAIVNKNQQHCSYLGESLEKLAGAMHAIVQRTSKNAKKGSIHSRELQLIQSRDDILNPPLEFHATRID